MVPVMRGPAPIPVPAGQVMVAMPPQRLGCELDNGAALVLFDLDLKLAALASVLLPESRGSLSSAMPAKHADRAVPAALQALLPRGAARWRLQAEIVGGAVDPARPELGPAIVAALRESLAGHGIEIHREEVGGHRARRVTFDPQYCELTVERLSRL